MTNTLTRMLTNTVIDRMADTANRVLELTPVELYACWCALSLGEPPMLLELRPPGRTVVERDRLLAEALAKLRARGCSDGRRPSPWLAEWLRLLAAAEYQLDIRLAGGPSGDLFGLGAVAGPTGIIVVRQGGVLRLWPQDGARVAAALIRLAGPMTPGTGRPVNIPADMLDAACAVAEDGNLWDLADRLIASGVPKVDAAALARMCGGMRSAGQLGVTARGRRGPWVIGFHRAESGWFMQLRRDGVVTISPTDGERLRGRWRELLEELYAIT